MNYKQLDKAKELEREIERLMMIRGGTRKGSYLHFIYHKKLFFELRERREVILLDDGLNEVITNYCDERIRELKKELEEL